MIQAQKSTFFNRSSPQIHEEGHLTWKRVLKMNLDTRIDEMDVDVPIDLLVLLDLCKVNLTN